MAQVWHTWVLDEEGPEEEAEEESDTVGDAAEGTGDNQTGPQGPAGAT